MSEQWPKQTPPQMSPETPRFNHVGYNQFLAAHRLMAARCTHCGELYLPPRPLCPRCYNAKMEWVELSGAGRLEGFTVIYLGLPAMVAYGYSRAKPYCSGVVRLLEGPAITALILPSSGLLPASGALPAGSLPAVTSTDLRVGDPLRAVFIDLDRGDPTQVALAFERKSAAED